MRLSALVVAASLVAAPRLGESQSPDRVVGWKRDIDSLVSRIANGHPNPWAHRSRADFMAQASALRDSVVGLSDGQALTGVMRLVASLQDGHTGVIDLGVIGADAWLPVRFTLFADGLWVTAIAPGLERAAGRKVVKIGGRDAREVIDRMLLIAPGDNVFNRRQHSAMLSNRVILEALGAAPVSDSLMVEVVSMDGRRDSVRLASSKGGGALGWEQSGEMFGPPGVNLTTAFSTAPRDHLDPAANPGLPLHLRARRAYWWTYVPESRTLYFQLNAVAARSRYSKASLLETWAAALASADSSSAQISRFILDLRYNSGGDGTLVPTLIKGLIKRDTLLARPGHFFVVTSGKTFSAAVDFLAELMKYVQPILVGEPPGAGLNASGDAGSIKLPYSGVVVSVSTRYTQTAPPGKSSDVIAVNIPAPMRGEDYFRRVDPALEAILAEPVPYPTVLNVLRESGGATARALWSKDRARYEQIDWWQPWRWNDLNNLSYQLLEAGRVDDAIIGFAINTERYPSLWETWDSLGEAYLKAGRKAEALSAYQRAMQIDPRNWNAPAQLRVIAELSAGKTP